MRYDIAKETGAPLFKEPLAEWDQDRIDFVAWMMFYNRVLNLPDATPSQKVLENDAELDKWIREYNLKKRAERTGSDKPKSAKDHKNIIKFGSK